MNHVNTLICIHEASNGGAERTVENVVRMKRQPKLHPIHYVTENTYRIPCSHALLSSDKQRLKYCDAYQPKNKKNKQIKILKLEFFNLHV